MTVKIASAADFSLSLTPPSPDTIRVQKTGSSQSSTITVTSLNGFNSPVNLSVVSADLPTGATPQFSSNSVTPPVNGSITSSFSINTSNVAPGSYILTIQGQGGSLTRTTTITLVVFDLSVALSAQSPINLGQSSLLTANISGSAVGTVNIKFDCTSDGTPESNLSNQSCGDSSNIGDCTKTYTCSASQFPSNGSYIAKVQVQRDAIDWTQATAGITANAVCTRSNPTVTLSPSSQSGNAGTLLSYTVSILNNDTAVCGASTFNLNYSCPSGWTCSLNSNAKSINPGSTDSSLTLSVTSPAGVAAANYTVSVTATNGGYPSYSGTGSATYIVSAAPVPFDFSISISPTSGSVTQGSSTSATVNTVLASGATTQDIIFYILSGLPNGATASFNPTHCSPSCSPGMTIDTLATTPVGGPYSVSVCACG